MELRFWTRSGTDDRPPGQVWREDKPYGLVYWDFEEMNLPIALMLIQNALQAFAPLVFRTHGLVRVEVHRGGEAEVLFGEEQGIREPEGATTAPDTAKPEEKWWQRIKRELWARLLRA
jgi:hypothetical protein